MSKHTFREILETADVTNQLREVSGSDGKYLCYTGLSADNCNWLLRLALPPKTCLKLTSWSCFK